MTRTKKKQQPKFVTLTKEQELAYSQCMHMLWHQVAADYGQIEGVGDSIPKAEVIEIVLDRMYGDQLTPMGNPLFVSADQLTALKEVWATVPFEQRDALAEKTFTYSRYEV